MKYTIKQTAKATENPHVQDAHVNGIYTYYIKGEMKMTHGPTSGERYTKESDPNYIQQKEDACRKEDEGRIDLLRMHRGV